MFRSLKTAGLLALLLTTSVFAQDGGKFPGIGRNATPKEVAAWDIDVRPDFKGLPPGSGSVAKGQDVWESKCAHCHGIFGESGEVFSPLVGGTTADDIRTGHVAKLNDPGFPGRTTLMKVATVSTLWDYIRRAMPWTAPKSLTVEEVYAVTGFLLNLGGIVPDDFVLSDKNIKDVQNRMPNRNGMTTDHAMWPAAVKAKAAKPDTANTACMANCVTEAHVSSQLPEYARNAHGNLAEQNRYVGAQHGADTSKPESKTAKPPATPPATVPDKAATGTGNNLKAVQGLLNQNGCTGCHAIDKRLVGPSFAEIAQKHAGKVDYIASKIKSGGSGVWGAVPMPPMPLTDADALKIATWLANGANK